MTERALAVPARFGSTEQQARPTWHDGDLAWLGLLLSVLSACVMIALVWWLVA